MGRLRSQRLEAFQRLRVRVSSGSTINLCRNTYSVHSRLIGEQVAVRLHAEHLQTGVRAALHRAHSAPAWRGRTPRTVPPHHRLAGGKPGAFENYRYRNDLFSSSRFRIVYDQLKGRRTPPSADKQYLLIFQLAAKVAEIVVDQALGRLLERGIAISADEVRARLLLSQGAAPPAMINVVPTQLSEYDALFDREAI